MKIVQDPYIPNRFIVSYQWVEQLQRGNMKPEAAFTSKGLVRAYQHGCDSWFHEYVSKKLARDKPFKPVRAWLKATNVDAVYQITVGGRTLPDQFGLTHLAVNVAGFAMVLLDMRKAALFKMWIAGFNDAEEVRLGLA